MRVYRTEITRAEFDDACRLYTTRPTTGTGGTRTGGTRTGGSTGTGNPQPIGIKDINTPIFDDRVVGIDPRKIIRIR